MMPSPKPSSPICSNTPNNRLPNTMCRVAPFSYRIVDLYGCLVLSL
jgi:hypothetical protein